MSHGVILTSRQLCERRWDSMALTCRSRRVMSLRTLVNVKRRLKLARNSPFRANQQLPEVRDGLFRVFPVIILRHDIVVHRCELCFHTIFATLLIFLSPPCQWRLLNACALPGYLQVPPVVSGSKVGWRTSCPPRDVGSGSYFVYFRASFVYICIWLYNWIRW